ncbi:GIY-YIG nuclease family protein [Methylosinus sp. sav-2]|uniref:GIY-YIG nuclease family protein n=1 Tax=Methylosinus sp. sav-2 TaxID=2485168 RepID=UPI001FD902D0|nr:GIY-YIG nuclease family protein [Methylosinus sp. sav-2]
MASETTSASMRRSARAEPDQSFSALAFIRAASEAPATPGAYALLIALSHPLEASAGRRAATLAPGLYLYCGSAKGPGGLRARLGRHMRQGKRRRWHIDQLTEAGESLGAWISLEKGECDLVAALSALPVPLEGFGSSDCPRCRSHLLFWPRGDAPAFLAAQKC